MRKVAFCSVLHQPWRVSKYSFLEIGNHRKYFDDALNRRLFHRVAQKSYLPALGIIKDLCEDTEFRINLSMTGTFFDQAKEYEPRVIKALKDVISTRKAELIGETYYHSLAFLISEHEFAEQVKAHRKLVREISGKTPQIFRNTESFYNDSVALAAEKLGFRGVITEGSEKALGWRRPGYNYRADNTKLQLFLRDYKLSDDIAFRFSSRNWEGFPLTADKYAKWLSDSSDPFTMIFIDFETFGEHHWVETGIFEFLKHLPLEATKSRGVIWSNLSKMISAEFSDSIHCPDFISWADVDRDLSAWLGNEMQQSAFNAVKGLESMAKRVRDPSLLEIWRKLTTSDHLYYMSTKFAGDEEVHSYFRGEAYSSPYEAYTNYMNIIQDFRSLLQENLS